MAEDIQVKRQIAVYVGFSISSMPCVFRLGKTDLEIS